MADTASAGYGPGMGYGPGYGMMLMERLHSYVGKNVTVYVGEEAAPIRGMLHNVGTNYLEVHRVVDGVQEAVLIPMQAVLAVSVPAAPPRP